MPRLYLVRHGETEWNAIGRLQGHTDIPLNARGRDQAVAIARDLANEGLSSIITSDLARARETGAIVAEQLNLPPPRILPNLRERAFGVFEGLTRDECMVRYPDAWAAWHAQTDVPPGAEALPAATARMHAILGEIAAEDGDAPVLIISHGGVMRLWLVDVLGGASAVAPLHNGITWVVERERDDPKAWRARLRHPR
jgi:broad specificity phosphatase PhoE